MMRKRICYIKRKCTKYSKENYKRSMRKICPLRLTEGKIKYKTIIKSQIILKMETLPLSLTIRKIKAHRLGSYSQKLNRFYLLKNLAKPVHNGLIALRIAQKSMS
jgi:hypothetical protein